MPLSPLVNSYRRYGGTSCLHRQGNPRPLDLDYINDGDTKPIRDMCNQLPINTDQHRVISQNTVFSNSYAVRGIDI
jgi:hypothetical protein